MAPLPGDPVQARPDLAIDHQAAADASSEDDTEHDARVGSRAINSL